MKTQKIIFGLFVIAALFSSCATHMGNFISSASLSSPNFKYISLVKGEAETSKFLGFGGMKNEALVAEAKTNMFQNYPLKDNQAYANICVDFKYSFLLLASKTKVTITADIVEFTK